MKIGKKLFWALLLFLNAVSVWSQAPAQNSTDLPKILPPDPTAQAFARYGEIPVDISTGVPSIEIPLYTIKSRQLEVPLSLSYHASGIKVDDISTPIGLGWVLKGMGVVSRTVFDRPDEEGSKATYTSFKSYSDALTNASTLEQQVSLGEKINEDITRKDKQADRYSFSLPNGEGGIFRYDFDTGNCIIMPFKPVNIWQEDNYYTIVDEKGTKYIFGRAYYTKQSNWTTETYNYYSAYTSWYLTKIISADGTDEIDYQYKDFTNNYTLGYYNFYTRWGGSSTLVSIESIKDCELIPDGQYREDFRNVNFITTYEPLIEKITTATTVVTFNYDDDQFRKDWKGTKRLKSILISDRLNNKLIKEIDLNNDAYFGDNTSYRLKLAGIIIKPADGTLPQKYTMQYNEGGLPPYNSYERCGYGDPYGDANFDVDYWGYYNGAGNGGLIPCEMLSPLRHFGPSFGGSRRPNPDIAKAYMLQSIQYPTGGTTVFAFEPNYGKYVYPAPDGSFVPGYVGGFRIRNISNYNYTGEFINTKSYVYGDEVAKRLNRELFSYTQTYFNYFSSMPCSVIANQALFTSALITQSSSFSPLTLSSGSPVVYTDVIEYNGDGVSNNGKTEYIYSQPDDPQPETWDRAFPSYWYDNGTYAPQLLTKTIFKKENGSYLPVNQINNTYQTFKDNEFSTGVNVVKYLTETLDGNPNFPAYNLNFIPGNPSKGLTTYGDYYGYVRDFNYIDLKSSEKVSLLTQTVENTYAPNGTEFVSDTTKYQYNLTNLQLSEKVTNSSKGEILTTRLKYPVDFTGTPVYNSMVNKNMITPIVEKDNYKQDKNKNDVLLETTKTNYAIWDANGNIIAPQTIESKIGTNSSEVRLRYNAYDSYGNLLSVSKENDVKYTYIWGYNHIYPVAQVEGADYSTVSGVALNANILNNPANDNELKTELSKLRVNLPNALVTAFTYKPLVGMTSKTDPNGKTSYYDYDSFGRLKIIRDDNGNIVKQIGYSYMGQPEKSIPGTFYNVEKSGYFTRGTCRTGYKGTSVLYTVPAYKYHSTTSQATANSLAQIELSAQGQAYADQIGTCTPAYANGYQSISFTKNDCGQGYIGSSVLMDVPAGTYWDTTQTAADKKAIDYINANGQASANRWGTCYTSGLPIVRIGTINWHMDATGNEIEDVVVYCYQDPACLVPLSVSGINVTVQLTSSNPQTSTSQSYVVSGTSTVIISNAMTYGVENNVTYVYTVLPGDGYNIQ